MLNIARRHLTSEQKRGLIRDQLKATPEQSNAKIAKALGVTDKTVAVQRRELEAGSEIPRLSQMIGADGKEYPRHVDTVRTRKPVSVFNPTKREERAMDFS